MKRINYLPIILLLVFSTKSMYGQVKNNKDQTIFIAKKDFVDILSRAIRNRNYAQRRMGNPIAYKPNVRPTYLNPEIQPHSNEYEQRLFRLESQMYELMKMMGKQNTHPSNEKIVHIVPTEKTITQKTGDTTNINSDVLKKRLKELTEETIQIKKALTNNHNQSLKVEKVATYKEIKKSLYFKNNKYRLSAKNNTIVQEIVQLLKSDLTLSVSVKGFASKKGSIIHNQNLSLQRTESVKKAIISEGISPGRVITTYHGEDVSNTPESKARRVEITIINAIK